MIGFHLGCDGLRVMRTHADNACLENKTFADETTDSPFPGNEVDSTRHFDADSIRGVQYTVKICKYKSIKWCRLTICGNIKLSMREGCEDDAP
jgi:hypothetical protein